MDWQLKPLARHSVVSGEPFAIGERVVCVLYRGSSGEVERADMKESEADGFVRTLSVLGRWTREVGEVGEEMRMARAQALQNAEELFLSLCKGSGGEGDDKEMLKQILALLLERKRIVRPVGRPRDGRQRYIHPRTKETFDISGAELAPDQLEPLRDKLEFLVF